MLLHNKPWYRELTTDAKKTTIKQVLLDYRVLVLDLTQMVVMGATSTDQLFAEFFVTVSEFRARHGKEIERPLRRMLNSWYRVFIIV